MTYDPDSCGLASSTQYAAPKSHSGKNLLFRHQRSRRLGTRCLPSATPTIGRCRRGGRSLTAEDSTSARDRLLGSSATKPRQHLAVHRTFDRCWAHGRASRRALEMGTSARDKVTHVSFRPSLPYPDSAHLGGVRATQVIEPFTEGGVGEREGVRELGGPWRHARARIR